MMYPYITFGDETEVVHSHLIEEGGEKKVIVHFERATEEGFRSARCELPTYRWAKVSGFSQEELEKFVLFLQHNAHLIFKYAEIGGVDIA